jgi:hypothetical protein
MFYSNISARIMQLRAGPFVNEALQPLSCAAPEQFAEKLFF